MNKFEELEAKKAELEALKSDIENDSEGALEKGMELKGEIENLAKEIEVDKQKTAILESIGDVKEMESTELKMNDFEKFVKNAGEVDKSIKGWSVGTHIKAATDVVTSTTLNEYDKVLAPIPTRVSAKSLFNNATISGNAITYFLRGAYEGTPAVTAEGALKPQNSTSFTPTTIALSKIAAYIKETDEIVNDAAFLASEVRNALVYEIGLVEDTHIITTITGTNGIQAGTYGAGATSIATSIEDGILYAIKAIKSASAYTASVVVVNPADMFTLMTSKDSNGQYIGGGYFTGAYAQGGYNAPSTIWGVPVFESSDVASGTVLVAARQAVNVWSKGGLDVKLYEQNEDDAIYNRVTLLAEERLACAVKDLNGVYLLTAE